MRHSIPKLCWLVTLLMIGAVGCQQLNLRPSAFQWPEMPNLKSLSLRSQSPESDDDDSDDDDDFETTLDIPMVGDHTTIAGLNLIALQGVGLVTGLPGTGSDPPPSGFRTRLVRDMRRRGISSPHAILRSPTTALVVIQAYLPPLVRKGDKFDIEVRVPGADETTSLNGGWLMNTMLSEQAMVPGQGPMEGHVYAKAKGPILISAKEVGKSSHAALLRRGRVLGGGISLKTRNLSLFLRNDFRSVRNSKRIADRIGVRFNGFDDAGLKRALAEAKTDQRIELIVPRRYRDNYPRYLQVIRNIAFRETEVAQRVRMQKLKKKLHLASTAERAALQLEAIGSRAIPILLEGLKSRSPEVRFHSAMSLTYLNQSEGLQTLIDAARDESAFRVFALAALSASEEPETSLLLRELLNEPSAETRYGAWRALTTVDRRDPIVRDERISDEFKFHVLNTTGPPMIHLTNRKKAEIVLFGSSQRLQTPVALRAGNDILVTASEGSDTVLVSRYEIGKPDRRQRVSTRIDDVIRAVAELDATYPDIAQMLAQADKQQNLPGAINLDAVPQSGRIYYRTAETLAKNESSSTRVGNVGQLPNLFSAFVNGKKKSRRSNKFGGLGLEPDSGSGVSSAVDIREEEEEEEVDEDLPEATEEMTRKWYDVKRYWKSPFGQGTKKQSAPMADEQDGNNDDNDDDKNSGLDPKNDRPADIDDSVGNGDETQE